MTLLGKITTAQKRIAAISSGLGVIAGIVAIAIWAYVLISEGYRSEIAGILALTVLATLGCLSLVFLLREPNGIS